VNYAASIYKGDYIAYCDRAIHPYAMDTGMKTIVNKRDEFSGDIVYSRQDEKLRCNYTAFAMIVLCARYNPDAEIVLVGVDCTDYSSFHPVKDEERHIDYVKSFIEFLNDEYKENPDLFKNVYNVNPKSAWAWMKIYSKGGHNGR
jgi:hypothetical protein